MATNDDIFGQDTIEDQDGTEDITVETLVGEGQKYKDVNDLAKSYVHADGELHKRAARIAELEAERKVLNDLLEARGQQPAKEEKPDGDLNPPDQEKPTKVEDISELVRKELSNAEAEKRKADNINRAAEELNKHYGSAAKAQQAIRDRAQQLNVPFDWLRDMAATSPDAFLSSMGVSPGQRSNATPGFRNEVIPEASGSRSGLKNMTFFEDIRKKNPRAYYSAEVQKQLFAARRELGDKFFT